MQYLARDQYGNTFPIRKYPRKELLKEFNRQHANKMYVDRSGVSYHIGYVIAGHWLTVWGVEGNKFATPA